MQSEEKVLMMVNCSPLVCFKHVSCKTGKKGPALCRKVSVSAGESYFA